MTLLASVHVNHQIEKALHFTRARVRQAGICASIGNRNRC
jgi:hypothetical protein